MKLSFDLLLQSRLELPEGQGRLREGFFDPRARSLSYLAVDIGGWLSVDEIIVAADRLTPPRSADVPGTLNITAQDLETAPRWTHDDDAPAALDIRNWPPIVIGPFGNTYAPIALLSRLRGETGALADTAQDPGDDDDAAQSALAHLERMTDWMGVAAFGSDGELGRIADIRLDPLTLNLQEFVLDVGTAFDARRAFVPSERLRYRARQGTHVVFDASLGDLVGWIDAAA